MKKGLWALAKESFTQALRLNPNNNDAKFNLERLKENR